MAKEKKLTCEQSIKDFECAYRAKAKLIERQKQDFLFRLGKQWDESTVADLERRKVKPVTDNLIQPNIFLLTGLERQNRSDFKAFPEGEEDSIKAEVASALFKDSIKKSDFGYKASEAFEDGITCGESNLELYLDYTYNVLNGKACWKKIDANQVFPEPGWKEYDYSDARHIYKLTKGLSQDDLIALFPDQKKRIEQYESAELDVNSLMGESETHRQPRDYPKEGGDVEEKRKKSFDLLERYYKKFVDKVYVGDWQTGEINEADDEEKAIGFVSEYQAGIQSEQEQFMQSEIEYQNGVVNGLVDPSIIPPPIAPEQKDPERFRVFKRSVPEIWYFAHCPGINEPLADERAWFYPKWKSWPIIPYFAHFSTAPIEGDDAHLKIQGIVHGVKGSQERHNKAETLKLMFLNSATNGGWLTPEDGWVDPAKVESFGAMPGVNLEYKPEKGKPERIFPLPTNTGQVQDSQASADSIKAQLGINADLLAAQEGSQQSGKAIALRQRQGLLMVQKLFDNMSRTKQIAGRLMLSQLGEIYDTETAKKVLGEAFMKKNFPTPMVPAPSPMDPATLVEMPMTGPDGQPLPYDIELAEAAIKTVLAGDLGQYDVAVGESVASETMKLANSAELQELAAKMPGLIPPDLLVEESQLNQATKTRVLGAMKQAQAQMMTAAGPGGPAMPDGLLPAA